VRWVALFRREALILAVCGVLAFFARGVVLEDDPIRSLTHPDGVRAALFDHYQEKSAFRGKIFVEFGDLLEPERTAVAAALRGAGYEEVPFFEPPSSEQLLALATLLPADNVRRLTSGDALRARAREVLARPSKPIPSGSVPRCSPGSPAAPAAPGATTDRAPARCTSTAARSRSTMSGWSGSTICSRRCRRA